MKVIAVETPEQFRAFLDIPKRIYANDPNYIPPLEADLYQILGKDNAAYQGDNLLLLLAYDRGEFVGRVAAFFYPGNRVGGIGFFECIEDPDVSMELFQAAEHFLKNAGCEVVQAPVNFGERDKFWGLMVRGFRSPSYQENYNPPYYRELFEANGYKQEFEQVTWEITPATFKRELLDRKARQLEAAGFTWKHYDPARRDDFIDDFLHIYNEAWREFEHFKPLNKTEIAELLRRMKPIFRNNLLWFTYDPKGKPIAFYLSIIELNQYLRSIDGKLNVLNKIRLWIRMRTEPVRKLRGLVFGVIPAYQNQGVSAGMIMEICKLIESTPGLECTELAWVGGFNPRMMAFLEKLGAHPDRRHITLSKKVQAGLHKLE
ncbi:MAG: hypothetical protein H6606_08895 [Flavobacteriales bacterium]|nr:hypothetical protein [Flavobacteriales bacterium]